MLCLSSMAQVNFRSLSQCADLEKLHGNVYQSYLLQTGITVCFITDNTHTTEKDFTLTSFTPKKDSKPIDIHDETKMLVLRNMCIVVVGDKNGPDIVMI